MQVSFNTCFLIFIFGILIQPSISIWPPRCPSSDNDVTWALKDPETNETCIIMTGYFKFEIPYKTKSGSTRVAIVPISCHSTISGDCGNGTNPDVQKIKFEWDVNSAEFTFKKNKFGNSEDNFSDYIYTGFYELSRVEAFIETDMRSFPLAKIPERIYNITGSNLNTWESPLELSFYCSSEQNYELHSQVGEASLTTFNVQIQPFYTDSNELNYGPRSYCSKDAFHKALKTAVFIFLGIIAVLLALIVFKRKVQRVEYITI